MKPAKFIVVGCGSRGTTYSNYILRHPERCQLVAVAEPDDIRRNRLGDEHKIPEEFRFRSWEEVAAKPRMADAAIVATQDCMHEAPVVALAKLGYHILLEKPMAPTAQGCRNIVEAVKAAGVMFGVCHVLRYTAYTQRLKEIIDAGTIGDIVTIQHLEPVGYWHQAHSFVRGNWRNEAESSFMLLAKCCHDIDWLHYVMGQKCKQIQSFGTLKHFRPDQAPKGAAKRCTECPAAVESLCPYSALKVYFRDRFAKKENWWPVDVLTPDVTAENLQKALTEGPYGRCVYACDNDVVDNQVVNMLFENGSTISMSMNAFNEHTGRLTRIFGTKGSIDTDSENITIYDFLTDKKTVVDTNIRNDGGILSGHGGGDEMLMEAFVNAVVENNPSYILSGQDETLESHLMVFAAEESRRKGSVINLN